MTTEKIDRLRARALTMSAYYGHGAGAGTGLSIVEYVDKHWQDYLPDAKMVRLTDIDAGIKYDYDRPMTGHLG